MAISDIITKLNSDIISQNDSRTPCKLSSPISLP
jgi:hypothetical protein